MATFRVTGGVLEGEVVTPPSQPGPPSDAHPEHPIYYPDRIWGGGDEPFPTPPIVIVIPPDLIGPGQPTHPIYLPVYPAHPIVIPPGIIDGDPPIPAHPIVLPPYVPAHPIVIPPGAIAPGVPAHPIVIPPVPAHPIVIPIPPGIWPNPPEGTAPIPEHPIVLPPPEGSPPETPLFEVQTFWTLRAGWQVVLTPNFDHPAPSATDTAAT